MNTFALELCSTLLRGPRTFLQHNIARFTMRSACAVRARVCAGARAAVRVRIQ